jgi:thiamine biosynthesis lipoprotein ApbE
VFGTSIVLRTTDPAALPGARVQVERELDAIDRACSRFRADSELSRVNAGGGRWVRVSELLMEAVELAIWAAQLTDGEVDPTVGRALELAGYDRDWRLLSAPAYGVSDEEELPCPEDGAPPYPDEDRPLGRVPAEPTRHMGTIAARRLSGWRTIALDRRRTSVHVPRGIHLDLGATAKAWAADRTAQLAAKAGDCGVLVSIGGDIATAGIEPAGGWHIHVTDDHRSQPTAPGQTIALLTGGLASSSTTVRRWHQRGRAMHHIIDPRTGLPVQTCWRTVSVAAASCAEANIAATAALLKSDAAAGWLAERKLPARLVDRVGSVLCVGDWPQPRKDQQ